jgi:hypothetical protein
MTNDPFRRTRDEIEDESRHSRAEGTVVLRATADELLQIAVSGKTISPRRLKRLHAHLFHVYELLGSHTVFGMGDEPATDAEQAALDTYRDTYSDGTLVSIVVGPPGSRGWSAPARVYDCGIPWLPNTRGNDGYVADGRIPPGCKVMVVGPPHRRMPKASTPCARSRTTRRNNDDR